MSLDISDVHIAVDKKEIVKGVSLVVPKGEVHVIMGPNGSGKSTLANALMGHPSFAITQGSIFLDNTEITSESPSERARRGLFLSMQYVPEIAGVSVSNFLRTAIGSMRGKKENPIKFHKELEQRMQEFHIDPTFAGRSLNVGFSGGEKKRLEILQLLMLRPTYAILDETDSGLDVDALKIVAQGINSFRSAGNAVILITHYNRLLEHVIPDVVHIMVNGTIIRSGTRDLALVVEKEGYSGLKKS